MPQNECAIIMSVYKNDSLSFLKEALESLYDQSFRSIDIFIQCDGELPHVVMGYLEREYEQKRVKYLGIRDNNIGLAASLNELLAIVLPLNYPFIARMDADDICHQSRFYDQINFMHSNKNIDVLGSDIIEFFEDGEQRYVSYSGNHSDIFEQFSKKTAIPHVTAIFRESFFRKAGLYNHRSNRNEDQWLWLAGFQNDCIFHCINKPLVKVRLSHDLIGRRGEFRHNFDTYLLRNLIVKSLKYPKYLFLFNIIVFIAKSLPSPLLKIIYKIR